MARTQVQSELLATNSISGTIIADNAITATHIATNAISGTLIQDSGIVTTMIAANNITATKVVTNAIQTRHIADDQVTEDKLANAINTSIAAKLPLAGGTMTGDLGIGGDPGAKLDVNSGTTNTMAHFHSTDDNGFIELKDDDTTAYIGVQDDYLYIGGAPSRSTQNLVINDGDGKVGIGTEGPLDALHITSAVSTDYRGNLLLSDSTAIATGVGGQINFGGKYTGSTYTEWAGIQGTKENATDGQYGGQLEFKTRAHNASLSTKMTLNSSGKVGINETGPQAWLDIGTTHGVAKEVALRITNADYPNYGWDIWRDNTTGHLNFAHEDAGTESTRVTFEAGGDVGIGTTNPSKAKLQVDGGSSGSGDFDALAIKHVDTTTTNDGPVMRFEGSYNSNDWALAEMKAVNGGAGHGADFQIKLHPGDGTQSSNVLSAFNLKRTVSNQLHMHLHAGGSATYADEASTTTSVANTSCLISVQSQRKAGGNSVSYDAALFFCHYGIDSGTNVIELADPGGTFAATDSDGFVCVYKGNNSANVIIKNRLGYSTGLSVQFIRFLGN